MNLKAVIPLGLAVVLGLVAAMLVKNTMSRRSATPASSSNLVTVVVAKQDVEPGRALTALDIGAAKVPADSAPTHVFSDPTQLVGRVVTTQLVRGQTILDTLLAPTGAGDGLQALIPPGMRAVTLEVNEFSSVGGMLQPGCRVDLISVLHDDKSRESFSRTILQNIRVRAIGRTTSPVKPVEGQPLPPPSNSVTLLVTPKQAQTLELASQSSRPWLVLRSNGDNADTQVETTSMSEVRGMDSDSGNDTGPATATGPAVSPTNTLAGTANNNSTGTSTTIEPIVEQRVETAAPSTYRKTITVIRGGQESEYTVTLPMPRANTVGTNTDQIDPLLPGAH